jgi:pimeloyl-ACP methyl ester carboxylesterase
MTKVTRGSVVSADGTEIGYSRFGEGSPIVICHGTLSLAEDWTAFARELGASNAVYLYDRRGRGRSPDTGKAYSFAAELSASASKRRIMAKQSSTNPATNVRITINRIVSTPMRTPPCVLIATSEQENRPVM